MMGHLREEEHRKCKAMRSFSSSEKYSFHALADHAFKNADLFSYVESTAVGLRMEPAAAEGFPQDGIVRFLQTLEIMWC